MPNVAAWLRHAQAAHSVVCSAYHGLDKTQAARGLALENVVVQINHLRTPPSVASAIARGALTLHGWFFDIETGQILALDGEMGRFVTVEGDSRLPVALAPERRLAAEGFMGLAAE